MIRKGNIQYLNYKQIINCYS